jgi:hypothetical protein
VSVLTEMTDEELCAAGGRLQKAHDYIEVQGFDIGECGERGAACCYIGSVKVCTGSRGEPGFERGSGVKAALRLLDDLAPSDYKRRAREEATRGLSHLGRAVELMGFKTCVGDRQEQASVALPVFRQAIREVQREMERRA